jgi:hypothetical protein
MTDAPNPAPLRAHDALKRLDILLATMGLWDERGGKMAQVIRTWRRWLTEMRPFIEAAAERQQRAP